MRASGGFFQRVVLQPQDVQVHLVAPGEFLSGEAFEVLYLRCGRLCLSAPSPCGVRFATRTFHEARHLILRADGTEEFLRKLLPAKVVENPLRAKRLLQNPGRKIHGFGDTQGQLATETHREVAGESVEGKDGLCQLYASERLKRCRRRWWLRAELNRRHKDFQSSALPTELPSRPSKEQVFNRF